MSVDKKKEEEGKSICDLLIETVGVTEGINILLIMSGRPLEELPRASQLAIEIIVLRGKIINHQAKVFEQIGVALNLQVQIADQSVEESERLKLKDELEESTQRSTQYMEIISKENDALSLLLEEHSSIT